MVRSALLALSSQNSLQKSPEANPSTSGASYMKLTVALSPGYSAVQTRTLALQKLHRICQAEVRRLKARYSLAAVRLALSKYRSALRAVEAGYLALIVDHDVKIQPLLEPRPVAVHRPFRRSRRVRQ